MNQSDVSSSSASDEYDVTYPGYDRQRYLQAYNNINVRLVETKKHIHLTEWLNIRKLLKEFNENRIITNHTLISIIDSIDFNRKQFITFLYEHMDLKKHDLHNIYNILKDDMLHNNNGNINDITAFNSNRHTSICSFDQLSIPSIENICSYLSKLDILSLKNTSLNFAVISLQEMKKYHIQMFNMNKLFCSYNNNLAMLKHVNTQKAIKTVRYNESKTMNKIVDNWSKTYGIQPQNMALIHKRCDGLRLPDVSVQLLQYLLDEESFISSTLITNYMDLSSFNVKDVFNDHFVVLDKSKMCIISDINVTANNRMLYQIDQWSCDKCTFVNKLYDNRCYMCNSNKDTKFAMITRKYGQQCVILLNYFDLKQQKITFCQSLIVHKKYTLDDLKHYIKKHVQIWVTESDSELFELLNSKDFGIDLYGYRGDFFHCDNQNNINGERDFVEIYSFQLYASHDLIYISNLRMHYDLILNESFCTNPIALMRDIYKRLKWKNNDIIPDFVGILSPLLTTHICAFLDADDIYSFKMVSSGTAMLCLKEMRKINIAFLHMTTILRNNMMNLHRITINKYVNCTRFHKETQMKDVCAHWSQQYDIPMDDLLILLCQNDEFNELPSFDYNALQLLCDSDIHVFADKSTLYLKTKQMKAADTFLIFDKRNMFQMDPGLVPTKTILLNYFDFVTKELSHCKPIVFTKEHITIHDIESFIIENARVLVSDALYQTMQEMRQLNTIQKSKAFHQNIFTFYTTTFDKHNEIQCKRLNEISTSRFFSNIIFQINNKHDLFIETEHISRATVLSLFRHTFVTFRYISNGLTLAQCTRYFQNWSSNDTSYNDYNANAIRIKVGPHDTGSALCRLISQQFKYEIPAAQIQLFVNLQSTTASFRMHWNESLLDIGLFTWDQDIQTYRINTPDSHMTTALIRWCIIPECWINNYSLDAMRMYYIHVYAPNNMHLSQSEGHETLLPSTKHVFYVPFKREFVVKELIYYLEVLCNRMYKQRSNSLLKYFGGTGDILTDEYSFVISSDTKSMENCYEYDAIVKYKVNISREITVFIVNNRIYKKNKHVDELQNPVIIRFKKKATKESSIGRPQRMWISKADLVTTFRNSPSAVLYNGFLSLINMKVHCFYNQISPRVTRKLLLDNDSSMLSTAIWEKQNKTHSSNIFHVLVVTEYL